MTLNEIKQAIEQGSTVHWSNKAYVVVKDKIGQYLICCTLNASCIGLTWLDGVTMNGKESEFFVA